MIDTVYLQLFFIICFCTIFLKFKKLKQFISSVLAPQAIKTPIGSISLKEQVNIFDVQSMQQFMTLQLVCREWRGVFHKVCNSKFDAIFYVAFYRFNIPQMGAILYAYNQTTFVPNFEHHALRVAGPMLQAKTVTYMADNFPNITCLDLFGLRIKANHLVHLLKSWPKLNRLTLNPDFFNKWDRQDWVNFWTTINFECTDLKHITMMNVTRSPPLDELFIGPISQRLETLQMSFENPLDFVAILDNLPLRLVRLNVQDATPYNTAHDGRLNQPNNGMNYRENAPMFMLIVQRKPNAFVRLLHFGLHFSSIFGVGREFLRFICRHFNSLVSLDIDYGISLARMLPLLVQLKHLKSVRFEESKQGYMPEFCDSEYEDSDPNDVDLTPDWDEPRRPMGKIRSVLFFQDLMQNKPKLIVLGNITKLYLANFDIFKWFHFDLLAKIFPNIEEIHFEDCEFPLKRIAKGVSKRRTMLEKLRQFSKLKRIFRNFALLLNLAEVEKTKNAELKVLNNEMKVLFKSRPRNELTGPREAEYARFNNDGLEWDDQPELVFDEFEDEEYEEEDDDMIQLGPLFQNEEGEVVQNDEMANQPTENETVVVAVMNKDIEKGPIDQV